MALLACTLLHERISLQRWAGILLIVAGVGFVAGGPSHTEREVRLEASGHTQPPATEPELAELRK
jgi:drug/metabolite transporter (DMT)-like permease